MSSRLLAAIAVLCSSLVVPGLAAAADPAAARLAREGEVLLDGWTGERAVLIQADEKIRAALQLDPASSAALVQRGRLQLMAGWGTSAQPDARRAAEESFLAAAAADPKSPTPHMLLGHLYTLARELPRARQSLLRAEELGSKDPWLYLNWASYHKLQGDHRMVRSMSEAAIATGKANAKAMMSAYGNMVWIAAEVDHDRKRADEVYRAMVKLQPQNAWTRGNYARTLIVGFADFTAAEALARETLRMREYPHAMQTLSMALYGQWAAAIDRQATGEEVAKLLAKARQLDPDGSMIPECAAGEPAMKSVMKHLAARGAVDVARYRC